MEESRNHSRGDRTLPLPPSPRDVPSEGEEVEEETALELETEVDDAADVEGEDDDCAVVSD